MKFRWIEVHWNSFVIADSLFDQLYINEIILEAQASSSILVNNSCFPRIINKELIVRNLIWIGKHKWYFHIVSHLDVQQQKIVNHRLEYRHKD